MEQAEVMERVVKILTPWAKNEDALASVAMETSILDDLKVNSARLVDVVGRAHEQDGGLGRRLGGPRRDEQEQPPHPMLS